MKKITNRPTKNYFSSKLQKLMSILHNAVLVTAQSYLISCLCFTQAAMLLLKDGSNNWLLSFGAVSDRHTKGFFFSESVG